MWTLNQYAPVAHYPYEGTLQRILNVRYLHVCKNAQFVKETL